MNLRFIIKFPFTSSLFMYAGIFVLMNLKKSEVGPTMHDDLTLNFTFKQHATIHHVWNLSDCYGHGMDNFTVSRLK